MLRKRLIAAILFITPITALIWLDMKQNLGFPGLWLLPTAFLASLLIAGELIAMLREKTPGPINWVVFTGITLCHLALVLPKLPGLSGLNLNRWELQGGALFVSLLLSFLHEMASYDAQRPAIPRIGLTMFSILYAGWLMTYLSATRLLLDNTEGALAIFSVLFVIKMSDAGAYFVGKKLGRRQLAARLSPKKTVEGFMGGMFAAVAAGFLMLWGIGPQILSAPGPPWWAVLGYAVSLMLCGVVGDLAESLIKRNMGCKDSSGWLPGLGGIMDMADSVLLSAPLAYLWWSTGLL